MRVRKAGMLLFGSMWLVLAASFALADVKLPALFTDNMVLQRDIKAGVWGTAEPGEEVTVSIDGQKATAKADAAGHWAVKLEPMKAGGPFELTIAGKNTLTLKNVLIGEVWICSGQSNMQMSVQGSNHAKEEIAAADFPNIRLFTVPNTVAEKPQADTQGAWSVCSPKTVGGFSAVAYFFGRDLNKKLNVPIGLIHTSWGGTPCQAWTSREAMDAVPELKHYVDQLDKTVAGAPAAQKQYEEAVAKWKEAVEKAKAENKKAPGMPGRPGIGAHTPSALYNAMIAPLLPFAIRGGIWYQGESNAGRALEYRALFAAMINDWRRAWGQGDFPFYFVQLASFMGVPAQPSDTDWAHLRDAQTFTLRLPATGQAVIIDIGESRDIHPKNKQDVGRRLALLALALTYGQQDLVYSGPLYDSMAVEGNKVRIKFKHVGGGLAAKEFTDPVTPDGPSLEQRFGKGVEVPKLAEGRVAGFAIAGEDKKFVWADAQIDGETVVVSSAQVDKPVAVRYAWADTPICNLYNKAGLPACPFRTDDWPRPAPPPKAPAKK